MGDTEKIIGAAAAAFIIGLYCGKHGRKHKPADNNSPTTSVSSGTIATSETTSDTSTVQPIIPPSASTT